jgi:hypothetical protein
MAIRSKVAAVLTAAALVFGFAGVARADNVQNDVVAGGNDTFAAGGSTTVNYRITANNGDGQTGCNAIDGTAATITVVTPVGVTAAPTSLAFTACGVDQPVVFSSSTPGDYEITVSVSDAGAGTYNTNPAKFTLHVTAPTGVAPTVTPVITGGTPGTSPWFVGGTVSLTWTVTGAPAPTTLGCGTQSINTDGVHSFTCTATNASGSDSDTATIRYDATPPTASAAASPAPNAAGWNNTDVTVTFTGFDATSGLAGCSVPVVLDSEGTDQGASGTCTDNAGNGSALASIGGIDIDKTAPAVTATATPAANANGWNNTAVTVSFSGVDALSGVAGCTADVVLTEGEDQSASGSCTDNAGNTTTVILSDIDVDQTDPIVSATATPAPNANGWNNTDVTVSFSGTDALSGIDSCSADVVLSTEGTNQGASGSCTDSAGNSGSATVSGINIDKTAPVASATASPDPNGFGWNNSPVTVTFTGTDNLSGIGPCDAPVVLSADGADQPASGTCTDVAGNVSAPATAGGIDIDMTAPTATATATPAANANGWNNTDVTVTFTGTDPTSGIQSCSVPVVLSAEGTGQGASGTCIDFADNESTPAGVSGIQIDKTAPVVTVGGPTPGATYYFGLDTVPLPTCTANDGLSGIDGACSVSGWSAAAGTHTIQASATDNAGNTGTSGTITYTVANLTLRGFYQPVDMGGVYNTVKGGSTVPLKFEVFAGSTEITDTSIVDTFRVSTIDCSTSAATDDIEVTSTGGTSLRYDSAGGQFIQNWQTPRSPGQCRRVTLMLDGGMSISALFKLK